MGSPEHSGWRLLSIVDEDRLRRLLAAMLDPAEFLSDHGIRSLSKRHQEHPLDVQVDGFSARLDYEPAESTSGLFGGNSNWRGPVWFPINYLLLRTLHVYHRYLGPDFKVECPTGSGQLLDLAEVADELSARLTRLFLQDATAGARRTATTRSISRTPRGATRSFLRVLPRRHGCGARRLHQTGWTGLVADLIIGLRNP